MTQISLQWLSATPVLLMAIVVVFAPGFILGRAAKLSKSAAFVAAPALSVSLISVLAVFFGAAHITWNFWTFILGAIVVTAVVFLLFRRAPKIVWLGASDIPKWTLVTVSAVSLIVVGVQFLLALRDPGAPPQTWDAVFHLSGVRYILSEGNASSLSFGGLGRSGGFYPAAWHDVVSLICGFGADVAVASNALSMVIMAIVWPLGAFFFTQKLFPTSAYAPLYAGLISTATVAFPNRVGSYGTLWPLLLGYALVPWVMALIMSVFDAPSLKRAMAFLAVAAVSCVGLVLAHPQALAVLVIFVFWYAASQIVRYAIAKKADAKPSPRHLWMGVAALLSCVVVAAGLIWQAKITGVSTWSGRSPLGSVWSELLGIFSDSQLSLQGYGNTSRVWMFALLLIAGVVALFQRKHNRKDLWLLGTWVTLSYLFLVASTIAFPGYQLVGIWYSDAVRLGGAVTLAQVPLIALGATVLADFFRVLVSRSKRLTKHNLMVVTAVLTSATIVIFSMGLNLYPGYHQLRVNYRSKADTGLNGLADAKALQLIRRIPGEIEPGTGVIGDPFTGAVLIYSLTDADYPIRYFGDSGGKEIGYLREHFNEIATDPKVCEVLNKEHIKYFFTDPIAYSLGSPMESAVYGGLRDVPISDGYFKLVDSSGSAKLYEITGCE